MIESYPTECCLRDSKSESDFELRHRSAELRSFNQNLKEYRICMEDVEVGGGAELHRLSWVVDFLGVAEAAAGGGFLVRAKFGWRCSQCLRAGRNTVMS